MEVFHDWTRARMQDLQHTWLVRAALSMPLLIGISASDGDMKVNQTHA